MHKYMRSIGFSKLKDRKVLQKLLTNVVVEGTERSYTANGDDPLLAEFCRDFTELQYADNLTATINLPMTIIFPI